MHLPSEKSGITLFRRLPSPGPESRSSFFQANRQHTGSGETLRAACEEGLGLSSISSDDFMGWASFMGRAKESPCNVTGGKLTKVWALLEYFC